MRLLALDLGSKRIGCATSDSEGLVASPLQTLDRRGGDADLEAVVGLIGATAAQGIVIGLPLQLDGSEGPAARRARRFAQQLAERVCISIDLWDERFSTTAAERALLEGNVRRQRRKEVIDKVAAALILQGYLDAGGKGAVCIREAGAAQCGSSPAGPS